MPIHPLRLSAALAFLFLCTCGNTLIAAASTTPANPGNMAPGRAGLISEPDRRGWAKSAPPPEGETYSVVVNSVKAEDLLFAIARDAKLNVDIYSGISGTVSLNAVDQTLQQLLTRIARQVDMRWELQGTNLAVMPDLPHLRTYQIDYVNMSRETSGSMSINSQVGSVTTGGSGTSGAGMATANNSAITRIEDSAKNHFWDTLERNLKDILRETEKVLPEGSSETVIEKNDQQITTGTGANAHAAGNRSGAAQIGIATSPNPASLQQEGSTVIRRSTYREAASVIINQETGVVSVRATSRQHEKVQEFLDDVVHSARRQVMIEATIVQVDLASSYQQGVNWSRVRADGSGFMVNAPPLGSTQNSLTPFTLGAIDKTNPLDLELTIKLLENFGKVKVLSRPKLSVLNNQTAILKVVENFVYFSVKSDVTAGQSGSAQKAFTTTPQTVSVGLVMSVTPQISASGTVILNVRPSVSSISAFQTDPNPDLTVPNRVPQIQTREIESIMRIEDGELAVLGGLMEERADEMTGRVPGIGRIPLIGELFTQRNNATTKSELVIFLRPVVVRDPGLNVADRELGEYMSGSERIAIPPLENLTRRGNDQGATR